jgi:hypothetical protein
MEGFHLLWILLIISEAWIGYRRFHTKDLCVIYYGLILMIDVDGEYLHEVLVIHLDRISQLNLITTMD